MADDSTKDELDKLKRLPPEERIKRLKELEKKLKEDMEKTSKLEKDSVAEAEEKVELKMQVPIEQIRSFEENDIFGDWAKEIWRMKNFKAPTAKKSDDVAETKEKSISDLVLPEKRTLDDQLMAAVTSENKEAQMNYQRQMSYQNTQELKDRLYTIQHYATETGYVSPQSQQEVYNIGKALDMKHSAMEQGRYTASERASQDLIASERVATLLMGQYRRNPMQ